MSVWYNEIDPAKAEWLRELIKAGLIARGEVDERSIKDVRPGELVRFTQCHFFAGIGIWSYALRLAGWPDWRPVWTASTPCPSFSAAGKGEGFDDPRHLWPDVDRLIEGLPAEHRPRVIFGEQVASAIGHGWLDLVSADLEAKGYAVAAAVLGAHSAGAPHIRQRLYFVAVAEGLRSGSGLRDSRPGGLGRDLDCNRSGLVGMAHAQRDGGRPDLEIGGADWRTADERGGEACQLENPGRGGFDPGSASGAGCEGRAAFAEYRGDPQQLVEPVGAGLEGHRGDGEDRDQPGRLGTLEAGSAAEAGAHGFVEDADGLHAELDARQGSGPGEAGTAGAHGEPAGPDRAGILADANGGDAGAEREQRGGEQRLEPQDGGVGELGLADSERCGPRRISETDSGNGSAVWRGDRTDADPSGSAGARTGRPGALNGFWRDADWLLCRDGKFRPVEPGTFPLVDGAAARVVRLRGYGDGICAQTAEIFIAEVMGVLDDTYAATGSRDPLGSPMRG